MDRLAWSAPHVTALGLPFLKKCVWPIHMLKFWMYHHHCPDFLGGPKVVTKVIFYEVVGIKWWLLIYAQNGQSFQNFSLQRPLITKFLPSIHAKKSTSLLGKNVSTFLTFLEAKCRSYCNHFWHFNLMLGKN